MPSMTRSKEDAEQWRVLSAEATQETVEMDSPFIRRRGRQLYLRTIGQLDPCGGMLGGAGTCMVLHLHIRSSRGQGKELYKVI